MDTLIKNRDCEMGGSRNGPWSEERRKKRRTMMTTMMTRITCVFKEKYKTTPYTEMSLEMLGR